jgi:hypothetical protein
MLKRIINSFLLVILVPASYSQTGGDNVYEFLNLTHSGLVSSLGGSNVSLRGNDLNMVYHNPALLNKSMDNSIALNYVNYFAGINYGMAMYSMSVSPLLNLASGITYLNYGSFTESDPSGNITGSFNAAEYAFSLAESYKIDSLFTAGINIKPVLSHLENYTSFGIAFDLGGAYHSPNNLFTAGLVIRNAGLQITTYAGEVREELPFEIQAGVSHRLAHAPFRFSLTYRHLEKFDLTHLYKDSDTDNTETGSSDFIENLMRHIVVGTELIPHKNFYLSAGYNYQRRRELQIESKVSTVGFSWGFGIVTSYMTIGFGRATYHLAGSSNHLSLVIRPDHFYRKIR